MLRRGRRVIPVSQMATSCNLKSEHCCRTEITDAKCPNRLQNMTMEWSDDERMGNGCNEHTDCYRCSCYENFCCNLGDLCNGWNGDLVRTGNHNQEWFCEPFSEQTSDFVIAPAFLLFLIVVPGVLLIRRIGQSRGGECYQQKKRAME